MHALLALAALVSQQPVTQSSAPYWQQHVQYTIGARLDEGAGVLAGTERVVYQNNSPDTLTAFSLHLYLNAFRPGSRWSDADSVEGRRRFNDLKEPDFGFNHVQDVTIMGTAVAATYPLAPDSTIVRFALPHPLAPGDSMTVDMKWDARPSTTARRQGRKGRRFDFAQWYPRVVVYDRYGWEEHPLYPAGEFYGEFGNFLVQLDVPSDEVMGATGVPICGDPGWMGANRSPAEPVDYQRNYYGDPAEILRRRASQSLQSGVHDSAGTVGSPMGDLCPMPASPGRKIVTWYADNVHHFAMSLNPDYRYEGGHFQNVAVHVLYQPGDEKTWGGGVAVDRTKIALGWLDQTFGPFGWPQLTNVHRIEGGGTEFPMMIHDGSADQGLIVHELGHNYVMGLLANNEWREGYLDEGFTSFQTSWFWEQTGRDAYPGTEQFILGLDLDDMSEPTSLVSDKYRDFTSYNLAIYVRGELFYHQLRHIVGDETMHRILQTYYARWKFKHVNEEAFRKVAEEVSKQDLSTFFAQWLHTTDLYDYAVGRTKVKPEAGGYVTRVEVVRKAPGRIPVDVAIIAQGDTAVARTDGLAEHEWVTISTRTRPNEVRVDPDTRTHDWNMLNNRKWLGGPRLATLFGPPGTDVYLNDYFSTRTHRDRLTSGYSPAAWYNDAGGLTLGIRSKDDYLGRFEQNVALVTRSTGAGVDNGVQDLDVFLRARNPVFLRAPNLSETFDAFRMEGRYGLRANVERTRRDHLDFGATRHQGATLQWIAADDFRYLDRGYYDDVGTVELMLDNGIATQWGKWQLAYGMTAGGGLVYNRAGLAASTGNANLDPFYFRGDMTATARRGFGKKVSTALRFYAGVASGTHAAAKQRQIYLAGADPYQRYSNPFLRSRGSILAGQDFYYDAPGGAGVRGIDPRFSAPAAVALSGEVERTVVTRPKSHLFSRVGIAAFGDLARAIGDHTPTVAGGPVEFVGDAGVGLRIAHRIGDTRFMTRFDLPLYVSRPAFAQDTHPGTKSFGFRWTFSFEPAW